MLNHSRFFPPHQNRPFVLKEIFLILEMDVNKYLQNEKYRKSVTVPDFNEHPDKYTVYKILLQIIPQKSADEEAVAFVVWHRYKEIRKLHEKLELVHKQLYLKGVFPGLAKAEFFNRHDANVIEERRRTTTEFLDFVVKDHVLCKSEPVRSFFEGCEVADKAETSGLNTAILTPIVISPTNTPSASVSDEHPTDNLSPSAIGNVEAKDVFADDHETAHPPKNLESFDPFLCDHEPVSASSAVQPSNLELLSEVMGDSTQNNAMENRGVKKEDNRLQKQCVAAGDSQNRIPKHESMADVKKAALLPGTPSLRVVRSAECLPQHRSPLKGQKGSPNKPGKVMLRQESNSGDYVVQAGEFICAAQKSEAEGVYDFAFTLYKSAVLLLLNGVQEEKDFIRRNAVRVQMAKYLKKAEKLYRNYLTDGAGGDFVIDSFPVQFIADVNLLGLQGAYSELKNYKCLEVLGNRVQLVTDVITDEKFVIKFLDKSCYASARVHKSCNEKCIPVSVPGVVKLLRFWELDNHAVVLLEYAAGGKLWDNLHNFFKRKRQNVLKSSASTASFRSKRRVSTARKVMFSVGESDDNKVTENDFTPSDSSPDIFTFDETNFETLIKNWAAQIICAICRLHAEGMICRNLNPNNILLDNNRNVLLSYFCLWYNEEKMFNWNSVDNLYCAPEVVNATADVCSTSCDWWSLGAILFELSTGLPLYFSFPQGYTRHSLVQFPDHISPELKDLIGKLLRYDIDERLGYGVDGGEIIKSHPFFDGINWTTMES